MNDIRVERILTAFAEKNARWLRLVATGYMVGECIKSAPVSGAERVAMLGMIGCSITPGAGHILTPRDHYCGDFKEGTMK